MLQDHLMRTSASDESLKISSDHPTACNNLHYSLLVACKACKLLHFRCIAYLSSPEQYDEVREMDLLNVMPDET